jgi:hypothetical protein
MRKESFHLKGKVPVESDKLKMYKRGDFNPSAQSLTKLSVKSYSDEKH